MTIQPAVSNRCGHSRSRSSGATGCSTRPPVVPDRAARRLRSERSPGVSRTDGRCSFGWRRLRNARRCSMTATGERSRLQSNRDRAVRRRLRAGVFRLGGYLGWDRQKVVRFSEATAGRPWRRCDRTGLLQVLGSPASPRY